MIGSSQSLGMTRKKILMFTVNVQQMPLKNLHSLVVFLSYNSLKEFLVFTDGP